MLESLLNLVLFAAVLLGTPGPAPLAIAATGAAFGLRQGALFVVGLLLGFAVVLVVESWGLSLLFERFPMWQRLLQWFGLAYVLYLAQKIVRSAPMTADQAPTKPPSLVDGLVLNVTNPKAYAAVLVIYSQFLLPLEPPLWAYIATGLVCFAVVVVIDLAWLLLGRWLRPWFKHPRTGRIIRWFFAVAMVVAVGLILWLAE